MKKYLIYFAVAALVGCQQEPVGLTQKETSTGPSPEPSLSRSGNTIGVNPVPNSAMVYAAYHDWSGLIETKVWSIDYDYPANKPNGYVQLPSDYVLVGGGAWTMQTSNNAGAFLTESRPDWANQRWYAASKDHINADPHVLRVYAVGMKITGVSATNLMSAMTVVYAHSPSSPLQSHPNWFVKMTPGYKIIGGGARVNWTGAGNLLTKTWVTTEPDGDYWWAESKDHIISSPAWIELWAIGIPATIPGFNGTIEITNNLFDASIFWTTGAANITDHFSMGSVPNLPNVFTPACPKAWATYQVNEGRMLCLLMPAETDLGSGANAASKDITTPSDGTTFVGTIGVRKNPTP